MVECPALSVQGGFIVAGDFQVGIDSLDLNKCCLFSSECSNMFLYLHSFRPRLSLERIGGGGACIDLYVSLLRHASPSESLSQVVVFVCRERHWFLESLHAGASHNHLPVDHDPPTALADVLNGPGGCRIALD